MARPRSAPSEMRQIIEEEMMLVYSVRHPQTRYWESLVLLTAIVWAGTERLNIACVGIILLSTYKPGASPGRGLCRVKWMVSSTISLTWRKCSTMFPKCRATHLGVHRSQKK